MILLSRSIIAVTAGFALVGLAACGGGAAGGTTTPSSQPAAGLTSLDPCKIATPQQLSTNGLLTQGTQTNDDPEEPGCEFKGSQNSDLRVTFSKNQTQTVNSYQQNGKWAGYTKTNINGRSAAHAQSANEKGNGGCVVLMDSAGGVVLVDVTDVDKSDDQVCGEAMKYAQQVEPSLPK